MAAARPVRRKWRPLAPLVLCGLLLVASPALADWQLVGTARDGTRYFVDAATLERTGETTRRIRVLVDRRTPAPEGWLSAVGLEEYECRAELRRIWSARFHSGTMGQGEETGSLSNLLEWSLVAVGSAQRAQLRFACELP